MRGSGAMCHRVLNLAIDKYVEVFVIAPAGASKRRGRGYGSQSQGEQRACPVRQFAAEKPDRALRGAFEGVILI